MIETEKTFLEIYKSFLLNQENTKQDSFTAACSTWLQFENSKAQTTRLSILYILYKQYAELPLDHNPFLTFFIQLVELPQPFSSIEHHFVYCILEETLPFVNNLAPEDICNDGNNKLPAIQKNQQHLELLKQKVARLIDDPDIFILNQDIPELMINACNRILTLSENEVLRKEQSELSNYPLTNYIKPNQLCNLIDLNQFLALTVVPILLTSDQSTLYFQAILNTRISINSIEVVHHLLVINNLSLSQDFLHYYISNSIRSCDQLEEGLAKDRQVKQVARFIQSLLEKGIITMKDYFVEIQSFCISYMKLKGVANLFRLASQEANQHHY